MIDEVWCLLMAILWLAACLFGWSSGAGAEYAATCAGVSSVFLCTGRVLRRLREERVH